MSQFFPGQTVRRPSAEGFLTDHEDRIRQLERSPVGATPNAWVAATLETGWTNSGGGYYNAAYRLGLGNDTLQLRGNITPDSPASSGTVAFTLDVGYVPASDVSFITDIEYGAGFTAARVFIDSATGDVTIEFPCECGTVIGS